MQNEWPFEFPGTYWIDEKEEHAVLNVLRNGSLFRYYGLGEPSSVDKLEECACEFYGVKYALAANSGTGALITSLMALGIDPESEVTIRKLMKSKKGYRSLKREWRVFDAARLLRVAVRDHAAYTNP